MPKSFVGGKAEAVEYIVKHYPGNSNVLDVGPGNGTYGKLLQDYEYHIEAVEQYEPYIEEFDLLKWYYQVHVADMVTFNYLPGRFDLVIFGDVIEHVGVEQAQQMLRNVEESGADILVSVPFLWPKATKGIIGDSHVQADLTQKVFMERYPGFEPIYIYRHINCVEKYGYFIYRQR